MATISSKDAGFLFPGYEQMTASGRSEFVHIGTSGVFDYMTIGLRRGPNAFLVTAIGRLQHRDAFGNIESLGGPLYQLRLQHDPRLPTGERELTITNFWDMRGDAPQELSPHKAEATLRECERIAARLRKAVDDMAAAAALPRAPMPLLIDCLRAQPDPHVEEPEILRAHKHALNAFALQQAEGLFPKATVQILAQDATAPTPGLRDGVRAPGGGATVYFLGPRRPQG